MRVYIPPIVWVVHCRYCDETYDAKTYVEIERGCPTCRRKHR